MANVFRFFRNVLACIGLLLVVLSVFPQALSGWIHWLSGPYNDPRGDVLVVLGADQLDTGTIGVESYWRSVYAARAWRQGGFSRLVICGGPTNAPVSAPMKDFVVSEGVPLAAITLEMNSRTTHENALEAARLLKDAPGVKVLVTGDYHMFRAVRAFQKAGLPVTPAYFPDAAKRIGYWPDRWRVFADLVLETGKIFWYKLHNWI